MACICCGRDDVPLSPIPSHIGNLKACSFCTFKHGAEKLAKEADRLLIEWFLGKPMTPHCLCCGDPLIEHSDGSRPVWCLKCEDQRKNYVNAQAGR